MGTEDAFPSPFRSALSSHGGASFAPSLNVQCHSACVSKSWGHRGPGKSPPPRTSACWHPTKPQRGQEVVLVARSSHHTVATPVPCCQRCLLKNIRAARQYCSRHADGETKAQRGKRLEGTQSRLQSSQYCYALAFAPRVPDKASGFPQPSRLCRSRAVYSALGARLHRRPWLAIKLCCFQTKHIELGKKGCPIPEDLSSHVTRPISPGLVGDVEMNSLREANHHGQLQRRPCSPGQPFKEEAEHMEPCGWVPALAESPWAEELSAGTAGSDVTQFTGWRKWPGHQGSKALKLSV